MSILAFLSARLLKFYFNLRYFLFLSESDVSGDIIAVIAPTS